MTDFDRAECLAETLEELQEDTTLLRLSILGTEGFVDELTRACLLRLTDYLDQHVNDICVLCRK